MNRVTRDGDVIQDGRRIGRVRKDGTKWVAEGIDGTFKRQSDAVLALIRRHRTAR